VRARLIVLVVALEQSAIHRLYEQHLLQGLDPASGLGRRVHVIEQARRVALIASRAGTAAADEDCQ
jgi:hypothetical protein